MHQVWTRLEPPVPADVRPQTLMLHNIHVLGRGTNGQAATTWLNTTLSTLQGPMPSKTWCKAVVSGHRILYAQFSSAGVRDAALALLQSDARRAGLWTAAVTHALPGEQPMLTPSSAFEFLSRFPARRRGSSCSEAQRCHVRSTPTSASQPPWLQALCHQVPAPMEYNDWQQLVSAERRAGTVTASSVASMSVETWQTAMEFKFGESWQEALREQRSNKRKAAQLTEGAPQRELAAAQTPTTTGRKLKESCKSSSSGPCLG